jgi:outer membrane lipopolysaccharide assembly protein LptE/RlpB
MKQLKQGFLLPLVLLLSACGSSIEGTTYADRDGNILTFKPKGKMSVHTGNQD